MSPIFWFSTFFFLSIILKEFNVYCMWPWKYEKSETSEPLLGFRNDKGGSSSSVGGVNHSNQKQIKSHNGKRILFITETREPHYSFAVNLANVLKYYGNYDVYFIIVDYYNTNRLKKPVEVVLIEVPFPDMEYKNNFGSAESPEKSWTIKDDIEGAYLLRVLGFHMFSSYKAIIENPTVNVNDKKQKIFDWLKTCAKVKFFDLGIAEFSYMTGALFIFKEIGLKKYIATTSIAPFPAHLHFLGYKYNFSFPGFLPVKHYFEICEKYQEKYLKLTREIALKKNTELIELIEDMPKIWNLFRKSKYYLVNVHNIEKYLIPETSTRIVDIAGIEIEIEKIIKEKERKDKIEEENKNVLKKIFKPALGAVVNAFSMNKDWIIKPKCLVLFLMGKEIIYEGCSEEYLKKLIETFVKYKECNFGVQVEDSLIELYHLVKLIVEKDTDEIKVRSHIAHFEHENISFYNEKLNTAEILAQGNVRGVITAGDQKIINEALNAGVPLILIPFTFEENINTKFAVNIKVGIYVDHTKFIQKFPLAVKKMLKENKESDPNIYHKNAKKIKEEIQSKFKIQTFLDIVDEAIKDNDEKEIFPEMPEI